MKGAAGMQLDQPHVAHHLHDAADSDAHNDAISVVHTVQQQKPSWQSCLQLNQLYPAKRFATLQLIIAADQNASLPYLWSWIMSLILMYRLKENVITNKGKF